MLEPRRGPRRIPVAGGLADAEKALRKVVGSQEPRRALAAAYRPRRVPVQASGGGGEPRRGGDGLRRGPLAFRARRQPPLRVRTWPSPPSTRAAAQEIGGGGSAAVPQAVHLSASLGRPLGDGPGPSAAATERGAASARHEGPTLRTEAALACRSRSREGRGDSPHSYVERDGVGRRPSTRGQAPRSRASRPMSHTTPPRTNLRAHLRWRTLDPLRARIREFLQHRCGDAHLADDLSQETFVRALFSGAAVERFDRPVARPRRRERRP